MGEKKRDWKKDLIGEGAVTGGLTEESVRQHYKINYMHPTEEYPPKLEVAMLLMKEKNNKPNERIIQSYRSLRFSNSAQIRMFILHTIKAYYKFMREQSQVRPDNFDYKLQRMLEDVEGAIRHPENYD